MLKKYVSLILLLLLPACWQQGDQTQRCVIPEYFMTVRDRENNVDSVAVWHGPQGQHWLIATAKSTHTLPIYDAATGTYMRSIGEPGSDHNQFQRPNGIAILDDLLFVVERDNKRLQLFQLPDGNPLGYIGDQMRRPYGIAAYAVEPYKTYMVYITDNEGPVDQFHPKKIHRYEVLRYDDELLVQYVDTFGDAQGVGALWKVESIAVDPKYNRVFVADEHEQQNNVKVYTLDGQFTGEVIGDGLIAYEPEGIALYETTDEDGYIVVTDQDKVGNQFWLFDRATLAPITSFVGKEVRNTDGITISNQAFGPFSDGVLYAVHDDGNIGAYDWRQLAALCGLK